MSKTENKDQREGESAAGSSDGSSGNYDRFGCLNNTIKVAAGHYVDLIDPDPASIDIESIAAALSKVCRYGGHCPKFYSVAEHCVIAAELAFADGLWTPEAIRAILMHDAAEAYIGDMVKPLKVTLPEFAKVENRMESAIAERFGLLQGIHDSIVKDYDRAMLKAEKIALWPEDKERWSGFETIPTRPVTFHWWSPEQAEHKFLDAAKQFAVV